MFGYVRRIGLMIALLVGSSTVFVVGTSNPALAVAPPCDTGHFTVSKTLNHTSGVKPGDTLTETITIVSISTGPLLVPQNCTLTVQVDDSLFNQTYSGTQSVPDAGTCTAMSYGVQCTYDTTATPTGQTDVLKINAVAGDPGPTGYCDGVLVTSVLPALFAPNGAGPVCATAASASSPPGSNPTTTTTTTTTATSFVTSTETVFPVGGVQTGEGGTARNSPLVPLAIAGGLLAFGAGTFRLRRRLGSN
jgi:hypothetical protein